MATNERKIDFLAQQEMYRKNAFDLIFAMLDWCKSQAAVAFMKELLHSIFFLARICPVPFTPEEIIDDQDILKHLVDNYPEPFRHLDQFPKRSPFSSALDLVILTLRPENEAQIKTTLQTIATGLQEAFPVSTTICISQRSADSPRYYGVSMATPIFNPNVQVRKFMIAASCCGPWDDYVAGAVMTFLPQAMRGKNNKDFKGAIKLPGYVRCEAFDIRTGRVKPPCKSCGNLFGLPTAERIESPYGNCAEPESLSKLFKEDMQVRNEVGQSQTGTDAVRNAIRSDIVRQIRNILHAKPFSMEWGGDFYTA